MSGPGNGPVDEIRPGLARLGQHAQEVAKGLGHALSSGSRVLGELVTLSPLAVLLAVVALGAWWYEHDQHLRQAGELHQLKKQTDADISQLKSEATAAVKEANEQRAGQIIQLELERQKIAQDRATLRQRLAALENTEQAKVAQVATLPAPEMVSELNARLNLGPGDLEPSAAANTGGPATGPTDGGGVSRATPAGSPPFPQPAGSTQPATPGTGRSSASALTAMGQAPSSAPPGTNSFELSEATLRKMSSALVSLDSCREQVEVKDQMAANCQQQVDAGGAIIDQQKGSIAKLNEALADQDKILAKSNQAHQQELKIVRGTWTNRVLHTLEHVAIGVAIGLAVKF